MNVRDIRVPPPRGVRRNRNECNYASTLRRVIRMAQGPNHHGLDLDAMIILSLMAEAGAYPPHGGIHEADLERHFNQFKSWCQRNFPNPNASDLNLDNHNP